MTAAFPPLRDDAILAARAARRPLDPTRPHAILVEREPGPSGSLEEVATIFVTNRECPFRCLMCDLWMHTLERGAPYADVSAQVARALAELRPTPHVKIYNSGSFFDDGAISAADRLAIAKLLSGRQSVIVECHPRLVDQRCLTFAEELDTAELQVAMGLETIDPQALERLNKNMTLEDFDAAARFLVDRGISVRAFLLLGPPGHLGCAAVEWAERSIDHAFARGVDCCVVIPVRPGNGIMDRLEREGLFSRPRLAALEEVLAHGLERWAGAGGRRVFADLWDIERFADCGECSAQRVANLRSMNLTQRPTQSVECGCGPAR